MRIKDILNNITHRPWQLPNESWKFYQEWNNAVFLHWEVDIDVLKELVPKELEIDLLNGKPWISLVAFTMEKRRPKNLPYFPPISNFDEINVRTYVKYKGKSGVYFLSIEGGKRLSCKIARSISELPYRYSKMTRKTGFYKSENKALHDSFELTYKIEEPITNKDDIDLWLTERYALFQNTKNAINTFEIHHIEWPVNNISIENINVNYNRFNKLIDNNPTRTAHSKGVQVIAWDKKQTTRTSTYKP